MKKINWKNSPDKTTKISAENLNLMQNNIEEAINDKNDTNGYIRVNDVVYYSKKGNVVTITGQSNGIYALQPDQYDEIGIIPQNYRPKITINFTFWTIPGTPKGKRADITPDGKVRIYSTVSTKYWGYSVTYVL